MSKTLEISDLSRFVLVSEPQISPNLDKVAFLATKIDEELDDYSTTIWISETSDGSPVNFLYGNHPRYPRWSPDARHILFVTREKLREKEEDAIWVASPEGGSPRQLARVESGVEQPVWFPDGSGILFLSSIGESSEDVRIIERIPLWFDAKGFTHHKRRHLHFLDAASGNIERLSQGEMDVVCASPSNKGDLVAFAASTSELDPRSMEIFLYDLEKRESVKLIGGFYIESLSWSPRDEYLLMYGSDLSRGYATHTNLWVTSIRGINPVNITSGLDRGCSRRVYYDLRSPYASTPQPVWDGSYIYFPVSDGGRFNIYRTRLEDRTIEPVVSGDFCIEEFSVKRGVLAYTKVMGTEPAEIYLWNGEEERKITRFNDCLVSRIQLAKPERFEFLSTDNHLIEGWIIKPSDYRVGEKVPAILDIHGGPKSKFGDAFMFEFQVYAAKGYAVIYLNPRGSDGYSQEFADVRGKYGTRDYEDIMEALDYIQRSFDFIDAGRIGVTGLSYGGFMTNWIVAHTDRFKAAVSQNGISNWVSFFCTSDIGFYFSPDQIGGDPWSNEEEYREKSPLMYAPNVSTPIMFIHSMRDYRCWIDQSILFYTALKYLGKKTKFAFFMEGSHVFRSIGRPSLRMKRLDLMLEWFDEHLKDAR